MDKVYERINWQNEPSVSTPINAANLNKIDYAVNALDDRVIELDTASKVAKGNIDSLISKMSTAESDIDALEKGLSSTQGIVYTVRDKVTKAEADIVALQKACETLENTKAPGIICTASGTDVVITDCSDMAFSDIEIDGASEQAQYFGKNLMPVNYFSGSVYTEYSISLPSGDYYVTAKVTSNDTHATESLMLLNYTDGTQANIFFTRGVRVKQKVTFAKDISSIRFYASNNFANSSNDTFYWEDIMISAEDIDYEPYVGGNPSPSPEYPQPIKSVGDSGSLEIKTVGKNKFDVNGDKITETASHKYVYKLKPNTKYTVSSDVPHTTMASLYANGGSTAENGVWQGKSVTVTSDNNGEFFIYVRFSAGGSQDETVLLYEKVLDGTYYIQIEEGEVTTPYQPYQSNSITIPLSEPLRQYDKIVKQDGVREVLRGTKRVVFNGSETWIKSGSAFYTEQEQDMALNVSGYASALCDKAIMQNWVTVASGGFDNSFTIYKDTVWSKARIAIYVNGITSVADFKAHIAENPITVEYELATPTFEPFDTEVQIAINSLHGYKTVTYVSTDSEVKPTIIVDYVADTKTYIDNKFNELAAALVAGSEV